MPRLTPCPFASLTSASLPAALLLLPSSLTATRHLPRVHRSFQVENATNSNQKDKFEGELKKQIKKLQVRRPAPMCGVLASCALPTPAAFPMPMPFSLPLGRNSVTRSRPGWRAVM